MAHVSVLLMFTYANQGEDAHSTSQVHVLLGVDRPQANHTATRLGIARGPDPDHPTMTTWRMPEAFGGDKKHGKSLLGASERRFIDWAVPKLPRWLRSWQLTLVTIGWSAGMVGFGYLAADDRRWLWAMSVMVFGQWLTDSLDGTLGRTRGEGLVKWGYFMDHFLDTIFAGSVVIGYSFLAPGGTGFLFSLLLLVTMAMMALSFLSFAATNQFQIAHHGIGPTEIRIGYIALNTLVFFTGNTVFWWGLPLVLGLNVVVLVALVWQTHKKLWAIDKAALADAQDAK